MSTLKFEVDPTGSFEGIKKDKLLASTGLLPYFAREVTLSAPESVQEAFDLLMECYGMGYGQDGSGWGTVDSEGMYISESEEDEPLAPLVEFKLTDDISWYVYQYAITGVTDGETTLMARMD